MPQKIELKTDYAVMTPGNGRIWSDGHDSEADALVWLEKHLMDSYDPAYSGPFHEHIDPFERIVIVTNVNVKIDW